MKKKNTGQIFKEIRKELRKHSNRELRAKLRGQIGGKVKIYGVKPTVRARLVKKYYGYFKKNKDIESAALLAERLIKAKTFEETNIGIEFLSKFKRWFSMHTFWRIERLLDHMDSTYNTDLLCKKILGPILRKHKHETKYLRYWADSTNRLRRRAAAVTLIEPLKAGKNIGTAFVMAKKLCREHNLDVLEGLEKLLKALKEVDPKRTKKFLQAFGHRLPDYLIEAVG